MDDNQAPAATYDLPPADPTSNLKDIARIFTEFLDDEVCSNLTSNVQTYSVFACEKLTAAYILLSLCMNPDKKTKLQNSRS
jgi:hypothetical protein